MSTVQEPDEAFIDDLPADIEGELLSDGPVLADKPEVRIAALGAGGQWFAGMFRALNQLPKAVRVIAGTALVVMMAHVVYNAVARRLGAPLDGTIEYVQYWYMPVLISMGLIVATAAGEHIEARLVIDRLSVTNQWILAIFGDILTILLSVGFFWYGLVQALDNAELGLTGGVLNVTIWPATFFPPIAFLVQALYFAVHLAQLLGRLPGRGSVATDEAQAAKGRSPVRVWLARVAMVAVVVAPLVLLLSPISELGVGIVTIALSLVLMFLGVPIGVALAIPGVLGLHVLIGMPSVVSALAHTPYDQFASWSLSVIPMFVFMGMLLWRSGLTQNVYTAGSRWLAWLPGGLAVGTTAAGAGLAAVSGSTTGTTYALARIGIPEMLRAGYHKRLATGSILMSGLPGQLIPPSIFMIIYAGIAGVPVGPQLLAGIVPGVAIAVLTSIVIIGVSIAVPKLVGRQRGVKSTVHYTWAERWSSLGSIAPFPVLIALVLGGLFTGLFTATEAGAAGAAGALIISMVARRKDRPLGVVVDAAKETVASVGSIFLLVVGAILLSKVIAFSGIGPAISEGIADLNLQPVPFLLLMAVVYIILGMFMEPLSIMLLTVPILIPVLEGMEISLLWYGVFAVFMGELAVVTPPVGILSFIVHSITKSPEVNLGQKISLNDIFISLTWFIPAPVGLVLLMIFFPEIATWLPDQMAK